MDTLPLKTIPTPWGPGNWLFDYITPESTRITGMANATTKIKLNIPSLSKPTSIVQKVSTGSLLYILWKIINKPKNNNWEKIGILSAITKAGLPIDKYCNKYPDANRSKFNVKSKAKGFFLINHSRLKRNTPKMLIPNKIKMKSISSIYSRHVFASK